MTDRKCEPQILRQIFRIQLPSKVENQYVQEDAVITDNL